MCQLNHANIVQFIGAVTEPSNLCIITQFCPRGSLADLLLDESIPMSYARKLKFALDAAKGMKYLHEWNPVILHRDLKSDNLLVARDWTVKVGDFGLTRFLSEKKAMTQVGTPMWMAPEIIIGKLYTEKADVYAFGIILWEILTRLEPYEDKEPMQIVVEVVNEDLRPTLPPEFREAPKDGSPPDPKGIPAGTGTAPPNQMALVALMKDCWHKDPNQRPTFQVVERRLQEMFANEVKEHPLISSTDDLEPDDADPDRIHPGDKNEKQKSQRATLSTKRRASSIPITGAEAAAGGGAGAAGAAAAAKGAAAAAGAAAGVAKAPPAKKA